MKIAAIQFNSSSNKVENLHKLEELVTLAHKEHQPDLIALPEMFAFMGGNLESKKAAAEFINEDLDSPALNLLKKLAKKFNVLIHGGSICEVIDEHFFNTTCIVDPTGKLLATYRKINLFSFSDSDHVQYDESTFLSPGKMITTYEYQKTTIGCAICFDLRFGKIFQQLIQRNVAVIIIPSAFTYETGQAHWEILLRARAIETQSYIIAPAQTGYFSENDVKKFCWGHTMIIDPWGNVINKLGEEEGIISAKIDLDYLKKIRNRLPVVSQIHIR